jgi:hypothetical protein
MPHELLIWVTLMSAAALERPVYYAALGLVALLVILRYACCPAGLSMPPGQPGLIRPHRRLLAARPPSALLLALAIAEAIVALPLLLIELLWLALDAVPPGWLEKIPGSQGIWDSWFDRTVGRRLADTVSAVAALALGVALVMLLRLLAKRRLTPSPGRWTALFVTAAVLLVLSLCGVYLEFGLPHLRPLGLLARDILYAFLVLLYAILPSFLFTDGIAFLIDLARGSRHTPTPSLAPPAPDEQPALPEPGEQPALPPPDEQPAPPAG